MRTDGPRGRPFLAFGYHHEQIDVTVLFRLSPCSRAEQDDLIGIKLVDQSPDDFWHEIRGCI
jgi:hypothetical protein